MPCKTVQGLTVDVDEATSCSDQSVLEITENRQYEGCVKGRGGIGRLRVRDFMMMSERIR